MTNFTLESHHTVKTRVSPSWHRELAAAIRDPDVLIHHLALNESWREPARQAAKLFPVMVTESYLSRIQPGDPQDPLLRQVLPLDDELPTTPGFEADAVGDAAAQIVPGLLQKYAGRALLITTGACAIHCRYCFRRHYPYGEAPRTLDAWEPAFQAIQQDETLHEIILSGGDPLMLTDARLADLIQRLSEIPHVQRLRIHSRLPIVLPSRVTEEFLRILPQTQLTTLMVVHANHPRELDRDVETALCKLIRHGIPTLNQSVLLKGVNDDADVLTELSEKLINIGVMPYYLHQLDRVQGAAHFEVPESQGLEFIAELRRRLPGYAVPKYVRETASAAHKLPITS